MFLLSHLTNMEVKNFKAIQDEFEKNSEKNFGYHD